MKVFGINIGESKSPSDKFIEMHIDLDFLIRQANAECKNILPIWNTIKENPNDKRSEAIFIGLKAKVAKLFIYHQRITKGFDELKEFYDQMPLGKGASIVSNFVEVQGKKDKFVEFFNNVVSTISQSGATVNKDGIELR